MRIGQVLRWIVDPSFGSWRWLSLILYPYKAKAAGVTHCCLWPLQLLVSSIQIRQPYGSLLANISKVFITNLSTRFVMNKVKQSELRCLYASGKQQWALELTYSSAMLHLSFFLSFHSSYSVLLFSISRNLFENIVPSLHLCKYTVIY